VIESQKGNTVFRMIKVEPVADLMRLEEVSILIGGTYKNAASPSENRP